MNTVQQALTEVLYEDSFTSFQEIVDTIAKAFGKKLLDIEVMISDWSHFTEVDRTVVDIKQIYIMYRDSNETDGIGAFTIDTPWFEDIDVASDAELGDDDVYNMLDLL